jgi:arylsulfatase A-like enzyme
MNKILVISVLVLVSGYLYAQKSEKPNIVLIYADDMGYGDPGCYGGTLIPTPNIDRLAKEGVLFTNGYVTAPVCGPSRYGILSGAYQQRFGIQWNQDAYAVIPGVTERIPKSQQTIDQTLSKAGYTTGIVGKWNLENYPHTTFNESMSVMHFGGDYWPDSTGHYGGVDEEKARGDFKRILWGPEREGDEYLTDRLGRQSVEFINRNKDKPFFLYLAFNAPHSPMQAKKSHLKDVQHIETEAYRFYAAMAISMDENIGKVMDALEELGIRENTIVAFASDNGPTYSYNVEWPEEWPKELLGSNGPLSGHKAQLYEGGIRVPYIISWPEKLKQGIVYDHPVSTLDFYPTFCAAASQKIPKETIIDGVNLLPYLTKKNKQQPHDQLFWYHNDFGAVRSGKWKLYNYKNDVKLFNLEEDIAEKNDLSIKQPEITKNLLDDLNVFRKQMPPAVNQEIRNKKATNAIKK